MSRRIEVELTSRRDDGSWTWRAAGAKQPKGTLDGGLLPEGIGEGDVVRVDADFEIDGIVITGVLPPKARSGRPDSERIEMLGSPNRASGSVTTARVGGRRGNRGRDGDRPDRRDGDRGPRPKRKPRSDKRGPGDTGGDSRDRTRDGAGRSERDDGRRKQRRQRDADKDNRRGRPAARNKQSDRSAASAESPERPARPKARKLRPRREHRDAVIAALPAEQQVVAEQVARGGLAAVRTEIEAQNRKAAAEGTPEVPADGLISLAESLVAPLQIAEWRDRADAAIAGIDQIDLRDLRSVLVAAEDFARDAQARALTERIRDGLNERLERSQLEWHDELRATLAQERVVRALRLSSRPPKAGAPLPPEIAQELTAQANAALGGGASQHRIAIVLEAVAYSPIRPYVVLPNIPTEPEPELLDMVRKVADRLPEVATALGIDPKAARPRTRPRRGRKRPAESPEAGTDASASPSPPDADEPASETPAEDPPPDSAQTTEPAPETSAEEPPADSAQTTEPAPEPRAEEPPADSDADDVAVEEVPHPA